MTPSVGTAIKDVDEVAVPPRGRGLPPSASRLLLPFDPIMALATLGLCVGSLITLAGATADDVEGDPSFYLTRQAIFFGVGLLLATVISRLDYTYLRRAKWWLFGFMLLAIVAVQAMGDVARGSRRSIDLGPFGLQASELGKLLLVVTLAAVIVDSPRRSGRQLTVRVMLLTLIPAAMVIVQPDLGSGLVYIVIGLALLYVAGTSWRHFAALFGIGALAVAATLALAPLLGVTVLHDYQVARLTAFLKPSEDPSEQGYHQNQARIAIGSGRNTGRGDDATQTKLDFLPEHHTDFVYASVGERWGFVGAAFVLSMYALLIWRGLRTLTIAKDLFGALIAGGIVAMLMFQVFVNVGMNVGIMPITGIPLPLFSYGGSSVLTTLLAIGLLQSIYAQGRAATARKGRGPTL